MSYIVNIIYPNTKVYGAKQLILSARTEEREF